MLGRIERSALAIEAATDRYGENAQPRVDRLAGSQQVDALLIRQIQDVHDRLGTILRALLANLVGHRLVVRRSRSRYLTGIITFLLCQHIVVQLYIQSTFCHDTYI